MKSIFLILFFLVNIITFGQEVRENQQLPSFSIKTENGILKSSNLKGKIVLINFFATWCGPCMQELPLLQKQVWEKYKNNKKFSMLVIGREHSQSEITEFKTKKGLTLPIYPDENKSVYTLFAKEYIPRSYIINAKGKIVYTSDGFDEAEFEKMVNKLDELLK